MTRARSGRTRRTLALVGAALAAPLLLAWLWPADDATPALAEPTKIAAVRPRASHTAPARARPPVRAPIAPDRAAPAVDEPPEAVDTGEAPSPDVRLAIALEDEDGRPADGAWPQIEGCRILGGARTGPATFEVQVVRGDTCTIGGIRRDGMLMARADAIDVDADAEVEVVVVFPATRTGGIGVRFEAVDGGILVTDVVPGTPAALGGLEPGDVIVEVGGIATADLSPDEFVGLMTGPEGSEVDFALEFEADTGLTRSAVTLRRAFLSG